MTNVHELTLGDVLRELRRSRPAKVALIDGAARVTYAELDVRVNRLANALLSAGVQRGGRIVWLGQNSYRLVELTLAAAKVGAIVVPLNWRMTTHEIRFLLDDLSPHLVVWQTQELGELVTEVRVGRDDARWIRHDGSDAESYEAFLSDDTSDPLVPVSASEPLYGMYTAATHGRPNCAVVSHNALIVQNLSVALARHINATTVCLSAGPMYHVATTMLLFATLQLGGTNVIARRIDAAEMCELVHRERCTLAYLPRGVSDQMVAVNSDRRYDLSSLRTPAGSADWNEMVTVESYEGAERPGFGQTELGGLVTSGSLGEPGTGTSARPAPVVQILIADEDGLEVQCGEVGEILVRGPVVMDGYYNRPELNALRHRGGWHHTNDLGRREADGSISFVGPRTRLIKSAGENIYPAEVEQALRAHAAVADCGVIGVPDSKWGQSVRAIVRLEDGQTVAESDLIAWCQERIASYKKPRTIIFTDSTVRDATSQVAYDELDAKHGGGGYPGSILQPVGT